MICLQADDEAFHGGPVSIPAGLVSKAAPLFGHMAYAANPNAYSPMSMKVSEEASKI